MTDQEQNMQLKYSMSLFFTFILQHHAMTLGTHRTMELSAYLYGHNITVEHYLKSVQVRSWDFEGIVNKT